MGWKIEFDRRAAKELERIDRQDAQRIVVFLRQRVQTLDDPRALGEPLRGPELGKFWKYRVGDYRIICDLRDRLLVILVVRIGHRREVYR
ncbi:MAG: type II toxin-antitoxin system RelE/ParE family toxin [Acidobacteriota bacterium]